MLPLRARPIGVDLDSQSIRIGQIERLADGVIRAVGVLTLHAQVRDEAPQRGAIGQEDREVIQTEQARSRNRPYAPVFVKQHERLLFTLCPECRLPVFPREQLKTEHVLVINKRAADVCDLQPHGSEPRSIGQAVAGRCDAVVESHPRNTGMPGGRAAFLASWRSLKEAAVRIR